MRSIPKKLALSAALILMIGSTAMATPTHPTPGNKGVHSTTSHLQNPGHIWLAVGASNGGALTSGGRYHDNCSGTRCTPGNGGDWSLDIDASGGDTTKLYVDMYGYSSGGVGVNLARNITMSAVFKAPRNYRTGYGSDPACAWQEYQIIAQYTGNDGVDYTAQVGSVYMAHQNFTYQTERTIIGNRTRATGYGGVITYFDAFPIGTVYDGEDTTSVKYGKRTCSTGPHTHIEFLSVHGYGRAWEWHSNEGPDGYSEIQTQTGNLNITPEYSDHFHYPGDYDPAAGRNGDPDAVLQGDWFGQIGGSSTSPYMEDNPYRMYH